MNISFPKDHGRSMFEKLNQLFEKGKSEALPAQTRNGKKVDGDVFEKAPVPTTETQPEKTPAKSGELNVSFQFDLFYQLTSKVEAKMGQSGAERFVELSGSVAETFAAGFNLKIDGVGSFMKNTDSALEISPQATSEFFDAVEGLADLSPEALENFLQETEDFFAELKNTYGDANGEFDDIKNQMQNQASAFFAEVKSAREQATGDIGEFFAEALPEEQEPEVAAVADKPQGEPGLIRMAQKPDMLIPTDNYQDFLKKFIDYTEKFRQQMLESFFSRKPIAKEPAASLLENEVKNLLKTAEPE